MPKLPALNAGEPRDIWQRFFAERKPKSAEIAEIVRLLHQDRQHAHAVACLETALINAPPEPWMYETLALSMRLDGRPKADVERVMLSRVDFTATAVPDMLVSAAYLKRLGFDRRALDLYQQASRLAPLRPEPYILGLRLARDIKDPTAVSWGAVGVLTNVWQPGYATHHKEADDIAAVVVESLRTKGRVAEADSLYESVKAAHQRDLHLRLTWAGNADVDFIIEEPNGGTCSRENQYTAAGGVYTHDGYGPKGANCYEEYICASGLSGDYLIRIRQLDGEVVGRRAELTIQRYVGSDDATVKTISIPLDGRDKVVRLTLHQGRREELATQPAVEPIGRAQSAGQPSSEESSATRRLASEYGSAANPADNGNPRAGGVGFFPVIGIAPDGIGMSAMAIVTGDRRFVKMSINASQFGLRGFDKYSIPSGR